MIRIRRLGSPSLPFEKEQLGQVQTIFRRTYPEVAAYADGIPAMLDEPFRFGFRTLLLVSQTSAHRVTGFSLFHHLPEISSSLLDFLVVDPDVKGGGIGGALYEATRAHLSGLGSRGLYLEVASDDPERITDSQMLKENGRRLRFYEHYGVKPVVGTDFEKPFPQDDAPPLLLFDGLGREEPLGKVECRSAVHWILTRKYHDLVNPDYIARVVESVVDDPVRFRPPRYVRGAPQVRPTSAHLAQDLAVVWSEGHRIHHVRERGYVERPARVDGIREALRGSILFDEIPARHYGERLIREVHDSDFVRYLEAVCEGLNPSRPVYPYVFPIRRPDRRPKDLAIRAGYYCIDTFTPLDRNAYRAARSAVDVAVTAADQIYDGRRVAYALCRPPGHHAERRAFGGFCYFNNAAVAAQKLSRNGRLAILDIDFHHGNGQQDIFWARGDVLTVSIHGHPSFAYPYFSGFGDEVGEGFGRGANRNFPLPETAREPEYLQTLSNALEVVARFKPQVLIVALGYDTMRGDPTGSFGLGAGSLRRIGARLAETGYPLLLIQEGGYTLRNLKTGSVALLGGILSAME